MDLYLLARGRNRNLMRSLLITLYCISDVRCIGFSVRKVFRQSVE
jgi:hypothetical protein